MARLRGLLPVAAATLLLSGCSWVSDLWFGEADAPPLQGQRVSVLELAGSLEPDPDVASVPVVLPPPETNDTWGQTGGSAAHAGGHLALNPSFSRAWSADIGEGSGGNQRLLTAPVVVGNRVFAADADGDVAALSTADGAEAWRVRVASPFEDSTPLGGGVAYADGLLYVSTGFGEVVALDPANGGRVWREQASGPLRAAPTVADGRVFVVTIDNQLEVYDAATGEVLYTNTGTLEPAGLLGGSTPAAGDGVVLVPYSSGELVALRADSGRPVWSDTLTAIRRTAALADLADIRGAPAIDGDRAFAVSNSGRTVAFDLRGGDRAWEQDIGGVSTPWVAGDFIFMLSGDSEVVALTRDTGRVRWVRPLARWEDPEDRSDPIVWAGPVLAGGQLVVVGSSGRGLLIAPDTGAVTRSFELDGPTTLPPVVAGGTLYVLSDDAELTAYR